MEDVGASVPRLLFNRFRRMCIDYARVKNCSRGVWCPAAFFSCPRAGWSEWFLINTWVTWWWCSCHRFLLVTNCFCRRVTFILIVGWVILLFSFIETSLLYLFFFFDFNFDRIYWRNEDENSFLPKLWWYLYYYIKKMENGFYSSLKFVSNKIKFLCSNKLNRKFFKESFDY